MRIEVVVPLMGESITGGTLVAWLKTPGERVRRGEDLFTISTDKVDADIPSPAEGTLVEVLAQPGNRVEVGCVVAIIEILATARPEGVPAGGTQSAKAPRKARARKPRREKKTFASPTGAPQVKPEGEAQVESAHPSQKTLATGHQPLSRAYFGESQVEPATRSKTRVSPATAGFSIGSVQCYTVWECDWSNVVIVKASLAQDFARRGIRLTMATFLIRAVVEGLRSHSELNGMLDGNELIQPDRISIAVENLVPGELVLPVVQRADELSLLGVARALDELVERARTGRLAAEEVQRATFVINNPDECGSLFRIPTVLPRQVAALHAGAIRPRVVADETGRIRVAPMNLFCLAYDSRFVTATRADAFLKTVVEFLEAEELTRHPRS